MTFRRMTGAALLGVTMAVSPVALASAQEAMPEAGPAAQVDGAVLDAFALAVVGVIEVRDDYSARFEAAETDADREAIAAEANEQMVAVIEAVEGMDLQTYLAIAQAAQSDAELNQRIVTRLEALESAG